VLLITLERLDEGIEEFVEKAARGGSRVVVTDGATIRALRRTGFVRLLRGFELVVFNERRAEEESLRIVAKYLPEKAYVCDQSGSLRVLVNVLIRMGIPIENCLA